MFEVLINKKKTRLGMSKCFDYISKKINVNKYVEVSFGPGIELNEKELSELKLEVLMNQYDWQNKKFIEEKRLKKYEELSLYVWSRMINYYFYGKYHFVYEDLNGIDFEQLARERKLVLEKMNDFFVLPSDKLIVPIISQMKKHEEKKPLEKKYEYGKSRLMYGGMNRAVLEEDSDSTLIVMDLPECISSLFSGVTLFDDEELLYLYEIFYRDSFESNFIMFCYSDVVMLYIPSDQMRKIEFKDPFKGHKMIKRIVVSNEVLLLDNI